MAAGAIGVPHEYHPIITLSRRQISRRDRQALGVSVGDDTCDQQVQCSTVVDFAGIRLHYLPHISLIQTFACMYMQV